MTEISYRPIDTWPGALTKYRKGAPFSSTWSATLNLLHRELDQLDAKRVVVQLALGEGDLRQDGQIRANAKLEHPGVIVAFDSKHGPLKYATDVFDSGTGKYVREWNGSHYRQGMPGWQCNLRAVALGLEALRKVDRYGITKRGEQYTGWKALGAGVIELGAAMSVEDAAQWMLDRHHAEWPLNPDDDSDLYPWSVAELLDNKYALAAAFRDLSKRLHPDVGGSADDFARLDECRRLIEAAR